MIPLHGVKTHPLTAHALKILAECAKVPMPSHEVNPGTVDRLLREDLVEIVSLPGSGKVVRQIPHLQITDAGRQVLTRAK